MAAYTNQGYVFGSGALAADSLVLKQWSPEVLRYGKDILVFANFLESRTELGKNKGDTVTVPIFGEMAALGTTALAEGTTIPYGTQDQDSVDINIFEYGRALSRPMAVDYFSNIALQTQLLQSLGWNWAKSWDALCLGVFNGAAHGVRTAAAGSLVAFGSNLTSAAGTGIGSISEDNLDAIYLKMRQNKVPRFPDGYYRIITNPVGAGDYKRMENFELLQIHNPSYGFGGLVSQRIGRYKGFEFVETQESLPVSNKVSYVFGAGVGAQAFGMPMDVRHESDLDQDYGRHQGFAWYTIGGVGAALRDKGTHLIVLRHGT